MKKQQLQEWNDKLKQAERAFNGISDEDFIHGRQLLQEVEHEIYQAILDQKPCSWRAEEDGIWHTLCDRYWEFSNHDGPTDNGMKFCCYCGKPLKEMQ